MTHQATVNRFSLSLFSRMAPVVASICLDVSVVARFLVLVTDVRTDTMCEDNDHLIGRGLVGQIARLSKVFTISFALNCIVFAFQSRSLKGSFV